MLLHALTCLSKTTLFLLLNTLIALHHTALLSNATLSSSGYQQLESEFSRCCSKGRLLADQMTDGKVAISDSSRCLLPRPGNRALGNSSGPTSAVWCDNIERLCCFTQRRDMACARGVKLAIDSNLSIDCADAVEQNLNLDQKELQSVAEECCTCRLVSQLIWPNSALWSTLVTESADEPCPGNGCCKLLGEDLQATMGPNARVDRSTLSSVTLRRYRRYIDPQSADDNQPVRSRRVTRDADEPVDNQSLSVIAHVRGSDEGAELAVNSTTSKVNILCKKNFQWDADQQLCIRLLTSCPVGMYFDRGSGKCMLPKEGQELCKPGFRMDEYGDKCEDINECKEGLESGETPCQKDMVCHNLVGSFNCTCEDGFQLAADGSCVDINECDVLDYPCPIGQQCRNVIGSFNCFRQVPCGFGYVLNPKTQECEDVDECRSAPDICGPGMMCINVRGGHKCIDKICPGNARRDQYGNCVPCPEGYKYNATTETCIDINECRENDDKCKPWQKCVNKGGYYVCENKIKCGHGRRANWDGTMCIDIDECVEKNFNCDQSEICVNTDGSYKCLPSPCSEGQTYDYLEKRCSCEKGYREENGQCYDINECNELSIPCESGRHCFNYPGGYHCINDRNCPPGFARNESDRACYDIDECQTMGSICGKHMHCQNSIGSYECLCDKGYKRLNKTTCIDIDECVLFRPIESCPDARARCVNTQGSYTCVCPKGLTWVGYPVSKCQDVDECEEKPPVCGKEHLCVNLNGSYQCVCTSGYQTALDKKSCVDIDECAPSPLRANIRRPCANSLCVNKPGSYSCQCPNGFYIGRAERCYDIDECKQLPDVCKNKHAVGSPRVCINLLGGYRCVNNQCPPHYTHTRLGNGFRCQIEKGYECAPSDQQCIRQKPKRVDNIFIELMQFTAVPQVLARVDTTHLTPGPIQVDLRRHYVKEFTTNQPVWIGSAFTLRHAPNQPGQVEVVLVEALPAPIDALIVLDVMSSMSSVLLDHSATRLHIYVTQSPTERIKRVRRPRWTPNYSSQNSSSSSIYLHRPRRYQYPIRRPPYNHRFNNNHRSWRRT